MTELATAIDRLEIDLMHAPTRTHLSGPSQLRDHVEDLAHRAGLSGTATLDEVHTRDWAEDGAPMLLEAWRRRVEHGVLGWAVNELPDDAAEYLRNSDTHGLPHEVLETHDPLWQLIATRYLADGTRSLTALGDV